MAITKETEEQIQQLQLLEQSMQSLNMQRQGFQMQFIEAENALAEIEKVESAYKRVGNIMVLSGKDDLAKELQSKKEILELRLKNIEKQESKIKARAAKLQEEILGKLKVEEG